MSFYALSVSKPTESFLGVVFNGGLVDEKFQGVAIHPTQLYEAFALLIVFVGLVILHRRKIFDGQVGLTYIMVYAIVRSVIEVFRGDKIRGFVIDQVPPLHVRGGRPVTKPRGPEAVAVVMPSAENGIAKPRFSRGPHPFVRVIRVRFPRHAGGEHVFR